MPTDPKIYTFEPGEKRPTIVPLPKEIEFLKTDSQLFWKYIGSENWEELISFSDVGNGGNGTDGREVELQTSATHIQWRYVGDPTWNDLVPLSDISGTDGTNGQGVPVGGSSGQFLTKGSNADFDTEWTNITANDVGLGNVDNVSAADLRDRSTHTGTQPMSSISDAGDLATKNLVSPSDINATNSATDGQIPSYDETSGGFIWTDGGSTSSGGGGLGNITILTDTDSPYTVQEGDQLAVNTTDGVVNLTAPAAGIFAVADIGSNADLNNIVIDFSAKNLVFAGTTYATFNHDLNNSQLVFVDDGTNYRVFG